MCVVSAWVAWPPHDLEDDALKNGEVDASSKSDLLMFLALAWAIPFILRGFAHSLAGLIVVIKVRKKTKAEFQLNPETL